jgi:hypothetical protein
MKVLLVAPRQNLPSVDEEIQNVLRSGLDVTPLLGDVRLPELMREIRSGQYDVLWFATHGSAEGVQLSDQMLTAEELVPLVRERFSLVVLNTCSSLTVAQLLQVEANVTVICTVIDVPDRQAFITGSAFAAALHESGSSTLAYSASIPGRNRTYLYLAALSPNRESLDAVMSKLDHLQHVVDRQRSWERKALLLSLSLHPLTWAIMWFLWSKA